MADAAQPHFARLEERDGLFVITLYDVDRNPVGHGYKGPTHKRAQADIRYWTHTKGLQELPS
ncbi:MAG: hypothetical protein NVS2B16_30010 [Chloroflexota bacterium]